MSPLPVSGLHHVKVPVTDLARSRAWYERLLDLDPELEFRDGDGSIRGVAYQPSGGVSLALREDPERGAALKGFNVLALLVQTREQLTEVERRLTDLGLEHTGVQQGTLGWFLGTLDPDGVEVKFYTAERHA